MIRGTVEITVRRDWSTTADAFAASMLNLPETTYKVSNLVVTNGIKTLVRVIAGRSPVPGVVAVGSGVVAATLADVALGNELYRRAVSGVTVRPDGLALVYRAYVPGNQANPSTISEAGLFTSAGDMIARTLHTPVGKTAGVSITYTWTLEFVP